MRTDDDSFKVTLQIRAKHADLYAAAKKLGSNKALADYLGIDNQTVCSWISMRTVPNVHTQHRQSRWCDEKWRTEMEKKLFDITHKTLDELWPDLMRTEDFMNREKATEVTVEATSRGLALYQEQNLQLPSPSDVAETEELRARISDVLRTVTPREAGILRLRFGLDDGVPKTLDEVGKQFQISRERVRGIEQHAIRKLRHPVRAKRLKGFLNEFSDPMLPVADSHESQIDPTS